MRKKNKKVHTHVIKFVLHSHTVTHGHKPDIKPCRTPKTLTTKTFTSRREQGKKTKNTHSAFSSHSPNQPPHFSHTVIHGGKCRVMISIRTTAGRQREMTLSSNQVKLVFPGIQRRMFVQVRFGSDWLRYCLVDTNTDKTASFFFSSLALAWLDWCTALQLPCCQLRRRTIFGGGGGNAHL